jgi:hypothetical protein
MRRPWMDLLTERAWSPTLRRNVLISKRQFALVAKVFGGRRTTQRELAASLGYSLGGVHAAEESLVTLGLVTKLTRLGCKGFTSLKGRIGAFNANVQEQGRRISRVTKSVSLLLNIPRPVPPAPTAEAPPRPGGPSTFAASMAAAGFVRSW